MTAARPLARRNANVSTELHIRHDPIGPAMIESVIAPKL
jgi:hypothetical protein